MTDAPWTGLPGPIGDEGPEDEYVLAVEGLYKRFGESPDLYHDLHLRIRRGEIVVIVGESGIGKSVFLKHLIGLEDPTRGGIWYRRGGRAARDWPIHLMPESDMKDVRREISMVFQASSLFDWMSVYENIALPLEEHRPLVQARLASYLEDPTELLVLLRRAPRAPQLFSAIAVELAGPRDALKKQASALRDAVAKGDGALERAVVSAFGVDAAAEVPAARFVPDAGSPWAGADSLLASWSGETLGDLLVPVAEGELPPPVRAFRAGYVEARRALRTVWSGIRRSWKDDFSDLTALLAASWLVAKGQTPAGPAPRALLGQVGGEPGPALAKVVEEWAAEAGAPFEGPGTGGERLRQALALLKVRPVLLAKPLERAGANAPAVFGPLLGALGEFARAREALERALFEATRGEKEAELRRAILLAWLSARPMAVDHQASSTAVLAAILDGFVDRPEELGLLLARRPVASPPPALARYAESFETFRSAFAGGFKRVLEQHADELTEQFTELVVNGLMASVKLDVARDREKLPSELSGGMRTRVGLARSLATLPSVVLYDEPTAGLDPVLSKNIAAGILELQTSGVVSTSIVVTHDKDLYRTLKLAGRTRMLYLSSGRFLDREGRPVRDPLRLGEKQDTAAPITEPGIRGYAPATFIEEFEPKEHNPAGRESSG